MAEISVISYSQLEKRLDAEYYAPKYLENEELIMKACYKPPLELKTLKDISKKIRKGIFYILASEYQRQGVPFVRVSNVKNLSIDMADLAYISEEKNREESKTCFGPGDILITKSGTLGNVALIPEEMSRCNISQDMVGFSLRKK